MKAIAHIFPITVAIVATCGTFACRAPSPEPAATTSPAAKAGPNWAFVEVGFDIGRDGKIRDITVVASDAPAAVQKQAVAYVSGYVAKPEIFNRRARQTFLIHRQTGKVSPMRVAVHSSQRPDGG